MLIFCKKCGNVINLDNDLPKRDKNYDIIQHCNMCGNDRFDVVGL